MKRGTTEHPKLFALCTSLGLRKYEAVGLLETLWHFTSKWCPQGDVGKYEDKAICKALDWKKDPQRLIDSLVTTGWLDRDETHRLLVHDWEEHSDQTLRRFLASKGLAFIKHDASEEKPAQPGELAPAKPPLPLPLPLPLPKPLPLPEPEPFVEAVNKHPPKAWFDEQHEIWYMGSYWNHTGKADSRRAYEKRVKIIVAEREITYDEAARFLQNAAKMDRERFEHTEQWKWRVNLNPATWLNGARWDDDGPAVALVEQQPKQLPRLVYT